MSLAVTLEITEHFNKHIIASVCIHQHSLHAAWQDLPAIVNEFAENKWITTVYLPIWSKCSNWNNRNRHYFAWMRLLFNVYSGPKQQFQQFIFLYFIIITVIIEWVNRRCWLLTTNSSTDYKRLIISYLCSNISAKNCQNWSMCVKVIASRRCELF